ncbi:hypothetical protein AeMF1_016655, partial [Aphanomyces euteiches]
RELVDNLFEESERAEGESVKAYAIRLQTILDDIDVPDHQGVVIFKRGVRHARAESCLDNTDKELTSISDCMKLLRTRQIRLDDPPVYQERLKSRPASASTNTTSSRTTYNDVSTTSTPEQSPRHTRKSSKVGFRDQATLEGKLEALKTTQSNQQAFVAQIQHLTEALNKPPNPNFAAPVQHAMNFLMDIHQRTHLDFLLRHLSSQPRIRLPLVRVNMQLSPSPSLDLPRLQS